MALTEQERHTWELQQLRDAKDNCEYNHSLWAIAKRLCDNVNTPSGKVHLWGVRRGEEAAGQKCFCGEETI